MAATATKGRSTTNGRSGKKAKAPYKADILGAYDIGYAAGWDIAHNIPCRFLAKTVAAIGFRKGLGARVKADKYITRYKKCDGTLYY